MAIEKSLLALDKEGHDEKLSMVETQNSQGSSKKRGTFEALNIMSDGNKLVKMMGLPSKFNSLESQFAVLLLSRKVKNQEIE